jgi:hypothetical protein
MERLHELIPGDDRAYETARRLALWTYGHIELGHQPAEGVVIVQSAGEMHSPAQDAPLPTAAPPKPADSAQSVTPPPARENPPPPSGDSQND